MNALLQGGPLRRTLVPTEKQFLIRIAVFLLLALGTASADPILNLVNQVAQSQYTDYQLALQNMGLGLYGGPAYNQGYRNRYNSGGSATDSLGFQEANLYLHDVFNGMKAWAPTLTVAQQSDYLNVIAELPGTDPDPAIRNRIFIISGHYDHPQGNWEAPGGDDNASGTAAVLEAARVMSRYQYRSTIRFIAWGGEEGWMYGSWSYVQNVIGRNVGSGADPNHQNVVGMLNLDMILRPYNDNQPAAPSDLDLGTRVAYPECQAWADAFRSAAAVYAPSLYIDPVTHGSDYYEWYASDQGPFMKSEDGYLYPGLIVAENTCHEIWGGSHPWYHTANDASDGLAGAMYDYGFATAVVRASVALLAQQAGIIEPLVHPSIHSFSITNGTAYIGVTNLTETATNYLQRRLDWLDSRWTNLQTWVTSSPAANLQEALPTNSQAHFRIMSAK